jgi:hypothetical protein
MLAGSGFGRWGFILGNVLMAFGAPVFVTSLVTTIANNRADLPARREDLAAIAAGAAFMLAGLLLAVLAGRVRPPRPPLPRRQPSQAASYTPLPARTADSLGARPNPYFTVSPDVNFGLDEYYNPRGSELMLDDPPPPARGQAEVPVQRTPSGGYRNSRSWLGPDRFHQPTITGMRSTGTRRRPPGG